MSESLRIPVDRLRAACELLIDHLAGNEGEVIELERDYFWSIDDVYKDPEVLGVGQVSEAWSHIEDLLGGDVESPTRHLVWLAEVLRAVGTPVTRHRTTTPRPG